MPRAPSPELTKPLEPRLTHDSCEMPEITEPTDDKGAPGQLVGKKTGVCLLYCFVLSPLMSLGAVPHHHLALSVKEFT